MCYHFPIFDMLNKTFIRKICNFCQKSSWSVSKGYHLLIKQDNFYQLTFALSSIYLYLSYHFLPGNHQSFAHLKICRREWKTNNLPTSLALLLMIKDRLESREKRPVIPRKQVIISSHQISGSGVSTRQEKHDFLDLNRKNRTWSSLFDDK